jgi:hypothetical protein
VTLPPALGPVMGVPWRPVALLTTGGLALLLIGSVWPTASVAGTIAAVGVPLLSAGTAYVLDEAASEAVAATPTTLRARSLARLVVAAAIVGLGALALALAAGRTGDSARFGVVTQLTGLALAALAVSAAVRRRAAEPGDAVAGGLLAIVLVLAVGRPLERWVELFPSATGQRWAGSVTLWGIVVLISLAVLWVTTRDPLD